MFNLKTAKWQLPLLLASVLAFSVPAHASKVKALVGLGNLHELFSTAAVDVDAQGDTEGSIGYGFTLDFTFGGSGALAIDYYVIGDTTDKFNKVIVPDPRAPTTMVPAGIDGSISGSGILIGGRWHADNGFYIGGGALGAEATVEYVLTIPTSATTPPVTQTRTYESERVWVPALTLGYDYTFSNGLALGVHVMRSLPKDIDLGFTPEDLAGAIQIANADPQKGFYMQSINFGIGYDW